MAARKAKPAPAPEVEVVDKPGLGMDDGVVFFTTILVWKHDDKTRHPLAGRRKGLQFRVLGAEDRHAQACKSHSQPLDGYIFHLSFKLL